MNKRGGKMKLSEVSVDMLNQQIFNILSRSKCFGLYNNKKLALDINVEEYFAVNEWIGFLNESETGRKQKKVIQLLFYLVKELELTTGEKLFVNDNQEGEVLQGQYDLVLSKVDFPSENLFLFLIC
jgi:hypothetical protein